MIRRCGWRRWATTSGTRSRPRATATASGTIAGGSTSIGTKTSWVGTVAAAGLEVEPAEDDGGEHEQHEVGDRHLLALEPEREQQPGGHEEQGGDQQLRAKLARLTSAAGGACGTARRPRRARSHQASSTCRFLSIRALETWLSRRRASVKTVTGEFARKRNVSPLRGRIEECHLRQKGSGPCRPLTVVAWVSPSPSSPLSCSPAPRRPRPTLRSGVGEQDVLPWLDVADYASAPGGDLESVGSWDLDGGAAVVAGTSRTASAGRMTPPR